MHPGHFVAQIICWVSRRFEEQTWLRQRAPMLFIVLRCSCFCKVCWELSISPSIENPTRSWLWGVLTLLVLEVGIDSFTQWFSTLHKTSFHACMHGSQRNKQTSILAPPGLFDELEAPCDGQHAHLPWEIKPAGRGLSFATADEAAYPVLLCSRMARLLQLQAERLNISLEANQSLSKQSKHSLGRQTISAMQLVSGFSHFHYSEQQCNIDGYRLFTDCWQVLHRGILQQTCQKKPKESERPSNMEFSGSHRTFSIKQRKLSILRIQIMLCPMSSKKLCCM